MKKLFILIYLLFTTSSGFCQLTVKPAGPNKPAYVYVTDQLLYVAGDVDLQLNKGNPDKEASIYLRKEAQLIQGVKTNSQNSGDGFLSVFQEGTSNAYDYNYWSSPVGNEQPGNGLFGIDMFYSPETETRSFKAGSMNALDGSANPLLISRRWIFTYSGVSYSNWKHIENNTIIPAGHGFTMKGVNGKDPTVVNGRENNPGNAQRYDFRGKPNTGVITVPVAPQVNVLVGNPYPSALDLSLFLLENSGTGTFYSSCYGPITRKNAITGIAYFWDSKENGTSHYLHEYVGGYGAFSPVDPCTAGVYVKPVFRKYGPNSGQPVSLPASNHYDRRYAPIAQGFMIEGASNTSLEFNNSHRIYRKEGNYSDFKQKTTKTESGKIYKEERSLEVIPKIQFEISINDHYIREMSLAFWPSATSGIDIGMDAKAYDAAPTDIGFLHNEKSYVIDIRPFVETDEIPLFLKIEGDQSFLDLKVQQLENLNPENLFIFDSVTGIYHSIKEKSFHIDLDPGTYHGRFKITFRDKTQKPADQEEFTDPENFIIFQNNKEGQLQIQNPGESVVSLVSVYDLSGKLIFSFKPSQNDNFLSFPTGHLGNSVYLVKVLYNNGTVKNQKITVSNRN